MSSLPTRSSELSPFWGTGTDGIIKKIRETVGDKPVYLSIDVRRAFQLVASSYAEKTDRRPLFPD